MGDLVPDILDAARNPKRARNDMGEAEAHSLKDMIEADRYIASKDAAAGNKLGVRFGIFRAPGAV